MSSRQFFFTQKHMLTNKRNLLVLFIEQYLQPWMSYRGTNFFTRIRIGIRTIRDFATRLFRTLPGSLTSIYGPANIAIVCRPPISLHKRHTLRFAGDIIDRSVIYPMGWPFCFLGSSNINVLPTLLINIATYRVCTTSYMVHNIRSYTAYTCTLLSYTVYTLMFIYKVVMGSGVYLAT